MYKVVLLRHGESQWNKENRFTGWADVGLTEQGMREAKQAAALLRDAGFAFVGPTTMFALMEAIGVFDPHLVGCHRRGAGTMQA